MTLTDADLDLLAADLAPGPSAYRVTDEDYEQWSVELELTLPPLEPQEPEPGDE